MKNVKIKKLIAAVMVLTVGCSMLTGCVGMLGDINVNADGSGTVTVKAGMSANAMEILNSMGAVQEDDAEKQEFTYNGVKYIGAVDSAEFSCPEEFNSFMAESTDGEDSGVSAGLFNLSKNADGTLVLTLTADETTGDTSEMESQMTSEDVGLDQETIDALMAEMAMMFTIRFASDVKQTTGETNGVTVKGSEISIDIIKLSEALNGKSDVLTFVTQNSLSGNASDLPSAPVVNINRFSDVNSNDWFYAAVNSMADGGLVRGVGNNMFAPNDTLTYAEFCQILARAQGLETGEQNGYWAYKAIESCRNKGYVIDLGDYTSVNYDVAMPREAAVAGMFRAKATELYTSGKVGTDVKESDIPDFNLIDVNYMNDILDAYNSGITNGTDSNRTFNPKGILTRAEVCQLFYNLNWTSSVK